MKKQSWKPIEKGDLVDIIAPGMPPKPKTLEGLVPFLESWGLKVRIPKDLLGHDLICSNSRELRAKHLKNALQAKDSQLIWCLRGGYGSLQLLETLQKIKKPIPKAFVGLSDITSLHLFLNQEWNWSTIHGCHIDRFARGEGTHLEEKRLKDLLFGKKPQLQYKLTPLNPQAFQERTIKGSIVGGNLITVQAGFGTSYQIKTRNQILFFEDIGERAYRIDRVFEQMNQMGLFKGVKAILFGQFTGGHEPGGKNLIPQYLRSFAAVRKIPVFAGIKSGHGENQHPLCFNTEAQIQTGAKPLLQFNTGVQLK